MDTRRSVNRLAVGGNEVAEAHAPRRWRGEVVKYLLPIRITVVPTRVAFGRPEVDIAVVLDLSAYQFHSIEDP